MQRDEARIERLLLVQTIAVDAAPGVDNYSAYAAPLDYMLYLLDQPKLRDRVSAISIDLPSPDRKDRGLLTQILLAPTRSAACERPNRPSSSEPSGSPARCTLWHRRSELADAGFSGRRRCRAQVWLERPG